MFHDTILELQLTAAIGNSSWFHRLHNSRRAGAMPPDFPLVGDLTRAVKMHFGALQYLGR